MSWASCLGGFGGGERRTTYAPNRNNAIHVTRGNIVLLQPCHSLFFPPSPFSVSSAVMSSESLPRSYAFHNRRPITKKGGWRETWKICSHGYRIPLVRRSDVYNLKAEKEKARSYREHLAAHPFENSRIRSNFNRCQFLSLSWRNLTTSTKIRLMGRKIEFAPKWK